MARTALLIANPAAGFRGGGGEGGPADRACARLRQLGISAEIYRTRSPRDAERAAREAWGRFDLVIAAGGDGTVHEVANGLALGPTPMGILPCGSMNILARELGMPLDPVGASEWLARAEPAPITLGRRDDKRWFAIMAGIGFDAFALEVALRHAHGAGRKVRFRDYTRAALGGAMGAYGFPEIIAEGEGFLDRGALAFLGNCARYGANLRITRQARIDEPMLDLVLFRSGRLRDLILYFAAVVARTPWPAGVIYRKVREVEIRPAQDEHILCQLDGERAGPLPARFRAVPGALCLLRTPAAP